MIPYTLTSKALLVLDTLDNQDGQTMLPVTGTCPVCREPVTIWRSRVICMTRTDRGFCPGNRRRRGPK